MNDFNGYPKIANGTEIGGELTETTGWLPEGAWVLLSDEELTVMARTERIARIHLDELPAILQLERDNQELV